MTLLRKSLLSLLLLLTCFCMDRTWGESDRVSLSQFESSFPSAREVGRCLIFKLDGCEIIAVKSPQYSSDGIAVIFVRGEDDETALDTATKLAKLFNLPRSVIKPFKGHPSCALMLVNTVLKNYLSTDDPLRLLTRSDIIFTGWDGKMLCANIKNSANRKAKVTLEMKLDITNYLMDSVEFRVAKYSDLYQNIANYISSIMGKPSTPFSLTGKDASVVRKEFNNAKILVHSTSNNFCVVHKSKTFYAGRLADVARSVKGKKSDSEDFLFPNDDAVWPERKQARTESADDLIHEDRNAERKVSNRQRGMVYTADLYELFPDMERDERAYLLRLDNSQIVVMVNSRYVVQLILVKSFTSKSDAVRTAKRLATLLSSSCSVKPFEGEEPSAAIIMSEASSKTVKTTNRYNNTNLLLTPYSTCMKKTHFIGWKGAKLIARVESEQGDVELTLKTWRTYNASGVEYKALTKDMDFLSFLFAAPAKLWGERRTPTKSEQEEIRKKLGCKEVLSYTAERDHEDMGLTIVSYGDNIYRTGWYKELEKMYPEGMEDKDYYFPENPMPWPQKGIADLVDTGVRSTEPDTPEKTTTVTPEPASEEEPVEETPQVEPAKDAQTITPATEPTRQSETAVRRSKPDAQPPAANPEDALRKYLNHLEKL